MKIIIIIFIFVISELSAIPILLNVEIIQQNEIVISWQIENPAENMKIEIGCFQRSDKKIKSILEKAVVLSFREKGYL